jgi:hypothetical protein
MAKGIKVDRWSHDCLACSNPPSVKTRRLTILLDLFLKTARSTGSKRLDVHTDRTQRRRDCPNSLGTRHTEAHLHTRTPTHARTVSAPGETPRLRSLRTGCLHTCNASHPSYARFSYSIFYSKGKKSNKIIVRRVQAAFVISLLGCGVNRLATRRRAPTCQNLLIFDKFNNGLMALSPSFL